MRVYTVHERPGGGPDDAAFVKDGFCWPALLVPALWLAYHRDWLGLVLWLVASLALGAVLGLGGVGDAGASVAALVFHVMIGFEANNWRRWRLARRGLPQVAAVAAADLSAAEMRYFQLRPRGAAAVAPPPWPGSRPSGPVARSLADSPALGLYPQPERWT